LKFFGRTSGDTNNSPDSSPFFFGFSSGKGEGLTMMTTGTKQGNTSLQKLNEVIDDTKLSKSSVYRKAAIGEFPQPIRLGKNSVAWIRDEIQQWIKTRPRA
jgi:prophage regulatory protein